MADTLTTNYSLIKQTLGDKLWHTDIHTSFDLIDAQMKTNEQKMILASLSSDETQYGITSSQTMGATVAHGDCLYFKSDGEWYLADADASTTMPGMALAMGAGTDGNATNVLHYGIIRQDTDWNWTVGGLIYVSTTGTTTNTLTQTAPSGSGDQVQVVGYALSADTMFFCPSPVLVEIA